MKTIFAAVALVIATPAAAQTANPHQGHAQHQQQGQTGHGQHQQQGQAGHGQHQQGHGQQQGQHRDGCCADRNNNGRPDYCEQAANGQRAGCCAGHGDHDRHETGNAQD